MPPIDAMCIQFCPIASGSSGNCIYFGTSTTRLLIDAGLSGTTVEKGLRSINAGAIHGIFVTHEHSDHVSGVGVLSRRFGLPVYASAHTWRHFLRHNTIGAVSPNLRRTVTPGCPTVIGDITVLPFDISHDAVQPVGYCLCARNYKVVVATDMGCVTDTVRMHLRDADALLLESNHDLEMLKRGRYPKQLKERVMGTRGHLSNVAAGTLLCEVASERLQYVFLGHLSEENNRPLIALDTVKAILDARQVAVKRLMIADRYGPSEMVELV